MSDDHSSDSVTHGYLTSQLLKFYLAIVLSFGGIVAFHAQYPHKGVISLETFRLVNKNQDDRINKEELAIGEIKEEMKVINRRLMAIMIKLDIED